MTDLQGAIDAINPNSTDEEWTRLLAEAMNAADEIAALRAENFALAAGACDQGDRGMIGDDHGHSYCAMAVENERMREALREAGERFDAIVNIAVSCSQTDGDPGGGLEMIHAEACRGWGAATSGQFTVVSSAARAILSKQEPGRVEVVDEGESARAAIAAIGGQDG